MSSTGISALKKEKAKLEEKIGKLEARNEWVERELDYLRGSMQAYQSSSGLSRSKQEKYGRHLDDKDSLKMERLGNTIELGECYTRLKEVKALLAETP